MAEATTLEVLLYGEVIGKLTRLPTDDLIFTFTEEYIGDQGRPTLSLSFKGAYGEVITDNRPRKRLPFFSNLLPEERMRSYLAKRARVNEQREFYLLWALGADLPGAVSLRGEDGEEWLASEDEIAVESDSRRASDREAILRFSLAGVQLKFSAVNEASSGLTIPASGSGGDWIVKLPSTRFPNVPENEYSMMALARLVGIDVPRIELVETESIANLPPGMADLETKSFAIERFDRPPGGGAVHIEDFAQVFGLYPDHVGKYEKLSDVNIASVIAAEGANRDIAEFVRRLTFNMLIGNADMHAKNWSLCYADRRTASLSPAYDFVSTVAYLRDETAALKVSRSDRFDDFSAEELSHFAARARIPEKLVLDTARETVAAVRETWALEKSHLHLSRAVISTIDAHMEKVPLARR